jgi:hypothetical protein
MNEYRKWDEKWKSGQVGRRVSHLKGDFDTRSGTREAKRGFRRGIVSREAGGKEGVFLVFRPFFQYPMQCGEIVNAAIFQQAGIYSYKQGIRTRIKRPYPSLPIFSENGEGAFKLNCCE